MPNLTLKQIYDASGHTYGTEVWRVENFSLTPVPKSQHGQFYTGDAYIVLHTYSLGLRKAQNLHFWIGRNASQDEYASAAIIANTFDSFEQDCLIQFREIERLESATFLHYFDKIEYLQGGLSSGFNHVVINEDNNRRLLRVKGIGTKVRSTEVDFSWDSFSTDDVYIIEIGSDIYRWKGKTCTMFEWLESARVAQNIRDNEQAGRGCIHILQEGWSQKSLPNKVVDALGPCPTEFQTLGDYEPKLERKASSGAILYKVSDDTGDMETTEVARGPGIDKTLLETDDMYILDFENSIMMWQGKTAKESEMAEAMQKAMSFLMKSGRSLTTQVTVFPQDREPNMFTVHFKNWDNSKYCSFDSAELYKPKKSVEELIIEAPVDIEQDSLQHSALPTKPVKKPKCLTKIASPKVPEALAKKRARYAKLNAQRESQKAVEKAYNLANRREFVEKARMYASEYEADKRALENNKKAAKSVGNFYVADEPRLALVIRIRGINQLSPKPKKTLQLLRLRQIGNCVFVRLNKASLQMLRIAEPFITWGYPSVDTIKKLIYKRGAVKINGQRIKLSDNSIVEKSVGKFGVTCVEDLVHEIYTVGENFKGINNSLYPIKLSCPRGGWRKVTNHFIEGGDFGNREEYINDLVKKMN